jgi:protoporphyrinogen oxidase
MAGLATAYRLSQAGRSVVVLEKEREVGGLARTLRIKGFQFDYCAHRFHTPDPALLGEICALMGDNFAAHRQKSRILMFGKFLKYPFELQNLLRAMPRTDAVRSGLDFLWNAFGRRWRTRKTDNYQDWFIHFFGRRLYRVMCEPYTRKIWGRDPSLISSDWADQRFQGANLKKLIATTVRKLMRLDFSSYSLADDELAPDGGVFHYPVRGGIQAIPERFRQLIEERGGSVLTGASITSIAAANREIGFTHEGAARRVRASEALISTIPLQAYVELLAEPVPADVQRALAGLQYMDIIFVFLFIAKPSISNDTWLYFPDRDVAFNRAVEFRNWSATMAPEGKTSLCLDITVTPENADLWDCPREALIDKCIRDCERVGLCAADEVEKGVVVRVPHAYPVYDLDYRRKLSTAVRFIESFPGVYCAGRTGIFRYQNSDGSIDMGFELGRKLLDPSIADKSIFAHSMQGVSY